MNKGQKFNKRKHERRKKRGWDGLLFARASLRLGRPCCGRYVNTWIYYEAV
mgnify:CR=1 FL=1